MSEETIASQDINVEKVFHSFYVVPDYQREYVWGSEQVEQFLEDINGERADSASVTSPEYFIGSVVVCPGRDGVLELIDGQQRMTTLFLVLCAVRDRIRALGEKPPEALAFQIAATSTDESGQDHFRYRLDLQYEDSGDVLVRIAKGSFGGIDRQATRSVRNIVNAYEVAAVFFRREFGLDPQGLRAFYGYLINKVKLIRIETKDVAKALKVFETINDRGVGLDPMDLLKNLLFMKAKRADFDKLKVHWKNLQDRIFAMGERPLRFLRYLIVSRYDVEVLREDETYRWFAENESVCGYSRDPVGFAKGLYESAQAYGHFLAGRDQHGAESPSLTNLRLLGGRAARQHLILLMSGRHLPRDLFDRMTREVEDLFFVYVITREPTRSFERSFANWAMELRRIEDEPALLAFIENRFWAAKAELAARFEDALQRLATGAVQRYRLRYVLAKLTQYIEQEAHGENEGNRWLRRYTEGGFEIEHIYPQTPSAEAKREFGEPEDPEIAERLGNLLLVEREINRSLGNRPYSQKKLVYPQSQLLLTKALPERPTVGRNTRIDRAVQQIQSFCEWNEAAVIARQGNLAAIARAVWGVPQSVRREKQP